LGGKRARPKTALHRNRGRLAGGLLAMALVGAALAGCTTAAPNTPPASLVPATSETSGTPGSPTAPATATPEATLHPSGTAAENLAYFKKVGHRLLDGHSGTKGRPIIDAFMRAGFVKKNMEVTPDKTSIGLDAWNIEFSVRFGTGCIIGQSGNVLFRTYVTRVLASGHCLIGKTRTIDW
jgi:hypothetical protein